MLTFEALLFGVAGPACRTVAHGSVLLCAAERVLATRVLNDARVGARCVDAGSVRGAVLVDRTLRLSRRNWKN
jgi:hypothetical protein